MMLALFLSLFAIFFVQGVSSLLESTEVEPDLHEQLLLDFGTVSSAMVSLFMAATGGNDWTAYYESIVEVGDVYAGLFLFFIAFSVIAFFNVISGVFCEKALSLAVPTMEEQMQDRVDSDKRNAIELSTLLNTYVDHQGTYAMTAQSFTKFLGNPKVQTYFEVRGLSVSTAEKFFELLLHTNDSSALSFRAFISACVRLDSNASTIDVHVLHVEMKALHMTSQRFQQDLLDKLEEFFATALARWERKNLRDLGVDELAVRSRR